MLYLLTILASLGPSLVAQLIKNPPAMQNAGDPGLIPGLGRCPGEGIGYPLQYYCLGQRSLARYIPWGHKEMDTIRHSTGKQD